MNATMNETDAKIAIFSRTTRKLPPSVVVKSITMSEKKIKDIGVDTPIKILQKMPMINMQISIDDAYFRS